MGIFKNWIAYPGKTIKFAKNVRQKPEKSLTNYF